MIHPTRRMIVAAAAAMAALSLMPAAARAAESSRPSPPSRSSPIWRRTSRAMPRWSNRSPPGAEIHNYQPTPRDILKAHDADLILWNGLNLELWFERFFQNFDGVPGVVVSEGVEPMGIAEGPYTGKPNPHAWMSPSAALIYVDNIRDAFVQHDPRMPRSTRQMPRPTRRRSRRRSHPSAPSSKGYRRKGDGSFRARAHSAISPAISA